MFRVVFVVFDRVCVKNEFYSYYDFFHSSYFIMIRIFDIFN